MVAEVFSAMIQGIEGQIVKIQVDISNGLPNFNMIGYLSNEVKESKERVRTALNNIGVLLPPKRISVNFAPADFRKCGTSFDIGVAAAILLAMDFVPETYIKDTLFVGELSLNGQICPISGVLPIVVAASKRGIKRCIVAQENVAEAAFVEQMEVVGCRNLEELFFYLKHGYIINDDSGEILENSGNISEDSGKECTIQDVKKSQEISESTRSLNLLVKDILENTDINFGDLNLKYMQAAGAAEQSYNSENLSGKSLNCKKLFKNTYGNVLKQKKLSKASLPKGFSASSLTKNAKKNINSAYSSATSSSSFKNVKNSVGTSSIFKAAQNGSSSYNLDFSGDSSNIKKKIKSEYDTSGKTQYDTVKKNLSQKYKMADIEEDAGGNYLGGIPKTIKKGVNKIKKKIIKKSKNTGSGGNH